MVQTASAIVAAITTYRTRYLPAGTGGRAFISASLALRYSRKSKSIIIDMAALLFPIGTGLRRNRLMSEFRRARLRAQRL